MQKNNWGEWRNYDTNAKLQEPFNLLKSFPIGTYTTITNPPIILFKAYKPSTQFWSSNKLAKSAQLNLFSIQQKFPKYDLN